MSARRSRTPLVPLIALLLSISSLVTGSELDSILIRSVGGPEIAARICALNTISSYGTIEMGGQVGEYREFIKPPHMYRTEMTFGAMTIKQGLHGKTVWMQDASGAVSELSGFEERALRIGNYFAGFGYLCPARDNFGLAWPREPAGGYGNPPVISFILGNSIPRDTAKVTFDASTGRLDRIDSRLDNLSLSQTIDEYILVESVPFPRVVHLEIEPIQTEITVRYDSILIDRPIDDSVFQWPGPPRPVLKMPPGRDFYVVTTLHYDNHVFVKAQARGEDDLWLLLDTGTSGTILDKPLFNSMISPNSLEAPVLGVGGYTSFARIHTRGICLGELCGPPGLVGVADLSEIAGIVPAGARFGGLLGYDLLTGYAVEIRVIDSQVVFHKSIDSLTPTQVAVPFRYTMRVPTVRAKVGNDSADFILDTGSPFEIVLFEATAKRFEQQGVLTFTGGLTNSMTGIGGPVTYRKGDVSAFELGPYKSNTQPVAVTSAALGLAGSREIAGNIGLPWLMKFNPIVDYPNMRLILDTSAFRQGNSE